MPGEGRRSHRPHGWLGSAGLGPDRSLGVLAARDHSQHDDLHKTQGRQRCQPCLGTQSSEQAGNS